MHSEHVAPGRGLGPHVDRIWSWAGSPRELPTLLPGTGAEVVFQHGAPIVADTPAGPRELPAAHLLCLRRSRWPLRAGGPVRFTAVRLRAGALPRFSRVPVAALADEVVPADEVFGATARRVAEALRPGDPLAARAAVLGGWLEGLFAKGGADRRVEAAVRRTYRDAATVRVDDLGGELGLSARHLRRGFAAAAGVPPKEFQRLARFQRSIRALLAPARPECLPVALDAGYYDQSHFIKEFRRFTGRSPARLLDGPVSHFYYPSIGCTAEA